MADVITRLKVESQEYDSKLKNAVSQMAAMEQQVRRTGATFAYADKEELDFVKSLGQLSTQAASSKEKVTELTNSFMELSVLYRRLTDEEKNSPLGKALQGSIQQLKGRIGELNGQLEGAKGELGGMGEMAKQLGSKLGVPVQMFTKLGPLVAAASAAIKVATDAFKQNDVMMDEWGRITSSATAIYDGFLNALNTGDISGFLQRIGSIVSAARDAYDAIDQLNTFNAFNQINVEKGRTALDDAITDFREGKGSKQAIAVARDYFIEQLQLRKNKEDEAYIQAIKELAQKKGVDASLLQKAMSGSYGDYEALKNTPLTGERMRIVGGGRTAHAVVEKYAANETEKLGEALRMLTDEDIKMLQSYGAQAQRTSTQIEQVRRQASRAMNGRQYSSVTKAAKPTSTGFTWNDPNGMPEAGSLADLEAQAAMVRNSMGGATTVEEYAEMEAHLNTILAQIRELKGEMDVTFEPGSLNDLNQQLREAQETLANLAPDTEAWAIALQNVADKQAAVNALKAKMGEGTEVQQQTEDVKKMSSAWSATTGAISQVGNALRQIDDPSARIAGMVAEAIASVASGLGQMLAQPGATSEAWGWIPLAISGTATMVSTIAAIKQATKGYAYGGMVEGNSYSGDNIVARLNAGEGVLTATGVNTAAQMAANANQSMGGMQIVGELSGETIRLALVYNNLRHGGRKGEYAII